MDKHTFIYSEIPMYSSVLGWILQQSSSYQSNYFSLNKVCYEAEERNDPWDNHSDDPNDWSHAFIKDVEDENLSNDFTWLNKFVDSFKCNTIFGLSYGSWAKVSSWDNNLNQIVIQPNDKMFDLFYELYERRSVNPEQLLENIKMHVHDHKQDNKIYNERMMNEVYPNALEYAKRGELEFWQLQYCFHHKGLTVPDIKEKENIKNKIRSDIFDTNFTYDNNAIVIEDLFNIELKELCKKLNIVYNDTMRIEHNKFLDYANLFIGGN